MAVRHDSWRNLRKHDNADLPDASTGNILKKLATPRNPAVVESHGGVQSVNVNDGAKPTQPKTNDGNVAVNAKFNSAAKGPAERANVVMVGK